MGRWSIEQVPQSLLQHLEPSRVVAEEGAQYVGLLVEERHVVAGQMMKVKQGDYFRRQPVDA
jgi:hypothetical protein